MWKNDEDGNGQGHGQDEIGLAMKRCEGGLWPGRGSLVK